MDSAQVRVNMLHWMETCELEDLQFECFLNKFWNLLVSPDSNRGYNDWIYICGTFKKLMTITLNNAALHGERRNRIKDAITELHVSDER